MRRILEYRDLLFVVGCWFGFNASPTDRLDRVLRRLRILRFFECAQYGSKVHRFGLVPLTVYLKLAMLYELCIAPSLLIIH